MKSSIYLTLIFILSWSVVTAQQLVDVRGQVSDPNGEPLTGALVMLNDTSGTTTGNDGHFQLSLPNGKYRLTVSYLGYDAQEVAVDTRQPDLETIILPVSSTTLNEILVSASPHNFKKDFKGSNYRISPTAINNINPLSTEEVLRTVPGINIIGDMGLSNRPNISIRGSWGRRSKKVLLMEDGSPAAPAPYVAPGAYYNPVSDRITAIEVYKGADMLRFGPNNMYGAVNYITALPPQQPEMRVKLATGQRNYNTALFSYGGTWDKVGALVEGVYKQFDGFTDNSSVEILNLNAKLFTRLSEDQSLYFKVSGQFEDNQASLSSQTPFTFEHDPTQNPLDADQFTMRRYGLDIIHKWLPRKNLSFTTKLYASDFERDWWRQITAKVRASEVRSYVGEQIYRERYAYLDGLNFDDEDYLIVGRINDGMESTGDSRWAFTVTGLQETLNAKWQTGRREHQLEMSLKVHQENYKDRFLTAGDSRWARSGVPTTDLRYYLWSASGYVRNEFDLGKFHLTPIFRFEYIDMYRQNVLALSQDPDLNNTKEGRELNRYHVALPGLTLDYRIPNGALYGSIYQGFIAPSKVFGFLVEQDGIITNPLAGESINIQPELSLNTELGWRGSLLAGALDGQIVYFNNTIRNFYAGGRNEVFQHLGKINIQGLEAALGAGLLRSDHQQLRVYANVTLLHSRILSGTLQDRDLFSQVVHNTATRKEYVDKVNANRAAYELYVRNAQGEEELFTDADLSEADFTDITRSSIRFGKDGVDDAKAPYTPPINLNAGLNYDWKNWSLGVSGQYVAAQFTEFHNFVHESADGAIGQLPAFVTMDAFVNYSFKVGNNNHFKVFLNGKNITNQYYRASRLNRATSGIFPGGFRQIIVGMNMRL
ncbi:MAG: TonB-dependent receptor [Saprospiraceae bacterium]